MDFKFKLQRFINENVKMMLDEYHNQQYRIPFEEYGRGNSLIDQYIDWLKAISKKGTLPKPSVNVKTELYKGISRFSRNEQANKDTIDYLRRTKMSMQQIYRYILDQNKSKFLKHMSFDGNGNLYVERAIRIDAPLNKMVQDVEVPDLHSELPGYFEELMERYNSNIGGCWSYAKDQAVAYCSDNGNVEIVFKGYMFLDDIYWEELVRLETRGLREFEVRPIPNGRVQLEEIYINTGEEFTLTAKDFDGPRIINATYLGNNGQFHGNYATLGYQKIGYDKDVIDRQGNQYTFKEKPQAFGQNELYNLNKDGEGDFKRFYENYEQIGYETYIVTLRGMKNIITFNSSQYEYVYVLDRFYDDIEKEKDGFYYVEDDYLYNIIGWYMNGIEFILPEWYPNIEYLGNKRFSVLDYIDNKPQWNVIVVRENNSQPVSKVWFDNVEAWDKDYVYVENGDDEYLMDSYGQLYDTETEEPIKTNE